MNLRHYLLFVLCVMCSSYNEAQTLTYNWLNTEMGLPSNLVNHSYRDSKGYMWFATKNGACRWDSKNFEYYTIANGLPNNEVYQIYEDSKGRIWFSTFSNTLSYLENGKIHNIKNDSNLRKINVYPGKRIIEYNEELYYSAPQLELSKYNLNTHKVTIYPKKSRYTTHFFAKDKKKIWLIERKEQPLNSILISKDTVFETDALFHYNSEEGDTLTQIYPQKNSYSFHGIFAPPFYNASYKKGTELLYAYYNNGNVLEVYSDTLIFKGNNHIISAPSPPCLFFCDKMLFASMPPYGVIMCRQIPILEYKPKENLSNDIQFLFKYGQEVYGINAIHQIIDIAKQKLIADFKNVRTNKYNLAHFNGYFYLSTSANIYKFKSPFHEIKTFKNIGREPNFKFVYQGKDSTHFFVSNGSRGGLYYFDIKNIQAKCLTPNTTLSIYSIFEDRSSRLWYSTPNKVYYTNNFKGNPITSSKEFILDKNIPVFCNQFMEDKSGNIFFTTNGGIFIYDGKFKYRIDNSNLLTDNECNKIILDSIRSSFWVATKNGLFQIKYTKKDSLLNFKLINRFYKTDGLFSNIINDVLLDSNKLYIATDKGMNVLDSLEYQPAKETIPIYVKLNEINGNPLPKKKVIDIDKLNYNQNNLSISFSALYYRRRDKLKIEAYLYRNDELISRNEITEDRINYYSLNDGKYKLVLYAFDQDYHYIHGQSAPFVFTIYPPYYKTWWFIGGLSLAIIIISTSILLWSLSRRRARELKQAELNAKLNESTLKSLQSQMNPHFVFNSLNTIQHFITSKKEADALDYLSDFSGLMRNMLEQSVLTLISLENEISFLHQYIQLEKTRFINSFELTWDVQLSEDDIVDIYIPTMLIQPILENAVKHGISNLMDKKGKIEVTFSLQNENLLLVTIKDNGTTFYHKSKKGNSIALQTIKDRLNIYTKNNNKGEYNLLITEEGAIATITIPI